MRTKFTCHYKSGGDLQTVVLNAVMPDTQNVENSSFWNNTPSGQISLTLTNPEAFNFFGLGEDFYVDFTHARQAD
jgi:hypothetical protein